MSNGKKYFNCFDLSHIHNKYIFQNGRNVDDLSVLIFSLCFVPTGAVETMMTQYEERETSAPPSVWLLRPLPTHTRTSVPVCVFTIILLVQN